jgi:hypothetical protein
MPRAPKPAQQEAPAPPAPASPGDSFVDAFRADWQANGPQTITKLRTEKPADYMRIALSLFAKDEDQESDPLHDLTDAELVDRIEEIAARIGVEIRPRTSSCGVGEADTEGETER